MWTLSAYFIRGIRVAGGNRTHVGRLTPPLHHPAYAVLLHLWPCPCKARVSKHVVSRARCAVRILIRFLRLTTMEWALIRYAGSALEALDSLKTDR